MVYEDGYIDRSSREKRQGHAGSVLWLTGLSGAGKSTLAKSVERQLFNQGYKVVVLDGDNLRTGLCADLGFSKEDRSENIRRFAHVAKLFLDSGFIVLVAVISPYEEDRQKAKEIIGEADFNEIFVFCPLEVCQERDPKGLYKKVKTGQISNLTGLSSPYQPPSNPSLRIDSSCLTTEQEVEMVVELLAHKGVMVTASQPQSTPKEIQVK
ncbi:MAG: adenylyl-sulfate kinase [Cyanobacteria bacterium]|nr:adenylyl-sulfate kinase [Cyanobacteriota bacterium]